MLILWGILAGLLLWLEAIYHIYGFGLSRWDLWYTLTLITTVAGLETLAVGLLKGRKKKIMLYACVWFTIVWDGFQLGYLHIFKQPLLWEAIFRSGQDALTNYWREALTGAMEVSPLVLLMVAPGVAIVIFVQKKRWLLPDLDSLQILRLSVILTAGISGSVSIMAVGKEVEADYYEEYHEFFDPLIIAERMGILPMWQRDTVGGIGSLADAAVTKLTSHKKKTSVATAGPSVPGQPTAQTGGGQTGAGQTGAGQTGAGQTGAGQTGAGQTSDGQTGAGQTGTAQGGQSDDGQTGDGQIDAAQQEPEVFVPVPNSLPIDFQVLRASSDNKKKTWLVDYIENLEPTMTNEYTGLFQGYNLIYLTAEGFSPYAVREDLTPTLYRLIHTGFVFENYYVPIWQTSTSDGEYVNCTGLIPDGQYSFRKSSKNDMAFSLPRYFEREGILSRAYHDNTLTYYDRHLSHPNLGYWFEACKLGGLDSSVWGDHVFEMEEANRWPASDYEMMRGTMKEYLGEERFHAYYMTVSGHMNYNFSGNAMSSKNRSAVAGLDLSENARAYIACNIELDKALEYMLQELEAAGVLDKTVICLSADHYPYAMSSEQYEELAGKDLSQGKDLYRNNLILWNAGIAEAGEPIIIDKACCSMDIIPTLLNLLGFAYDSRMYAGRDIFSDAEGLVIFNDRSFVTDLCTYDRKKKSVIWTEQGSQLDSAQQKAYLERIQEEVKDRYQFSAYILEEDYYANIREALPDW